MGDEVFMKLLLVILLWLFREVAYDEKVADLGEKLELLYMMKSIINYLLLKSKFYYFRYIDNNFLNFILMSFFFFIWICKILM